MNAASRPGGERTGQYLASRRVVRDIEHPVITDLLEAPGNGDTRQCVANDVGVRQQIVIQRLQQREYGGRVRHLLEDSRDGFYLLACEGEQIVASLMVTTSNTPM